MTATKTLSEVQAKFPDFKPRWILHVNGQPVDKDWRIESKYGSVHTAVVMHKDGTPNFDRPAYREADNINEIAYGWRRTWRTLWRKELCVAVIRQRRPHADTPTGLSHEHEPVVFGQIPMGFKKLEESVERAAVREAGEETGAQTILRITRPKYPHHNPNPTFCPTWSNLVFVEVNLRKVEELKFRRNEPIYSAEYISVRELIRRIREGVDEHGAVYRMCTANSLWMIFFATFPEYWKP